MILLLCFFRDQFIPADNKILTGVGTIITLVLIVICFYLIFISITELIEMKKINKGLFAKPTFEKRDWTVGKLFSFMEEADVIDILIEQPDSPLKIGTKSDYGRVEPFSHEEKFFDKCYYIEESEYESFEEFKEQFKTIVQSDSVTLLYVGIEDTPLDRL